jgi:hypothetical protein
MDIPRQFADLNAHVFLEVDQNLDQDASAIAAGFHQVQDQISHAFAELANIRPAGQIDRLPFPCDQNPSLVQVLFQGDDLLQRRSSADGDNNHQYLSIVRVVFQATEVLRHGNNSDSHPATSTEAAFVCATASAATTAAAAAACSLCATAAAATAATAATTATTATTAAAATAAGTICVAATNGATTAAAATCAKWHLCC